MSRRKHGNTRRQSKNRNQPPSKQGSARWRRRRAFGQNFLCHARDAERIVAASGVGPGDLVVEFGPGSGMLTAPLSKRAGRVIAVEKDPHFSDLLRDRFDGPTVRIVNSDARRFRLPKSPFKVVSNVPFGITTDILELLLREPDSGPVSGSLLVQQDVARKHSRTSPTTLKALLWSPWYELSSGLRLPSSAFHPRPKVDAQVLGLRKRKEPILAPEAKPRFEKFVKQAFRYGTPNGVGVPLRREFPKSRLRKLAGEVGFDLEAPPSRLDVHQWAKVFLALRKS